MNDFEKIEKRILDLPRQNYQTPDFSRISFKLQIRKLQRKTLWQNIILAAVFVLSTVAIFVSIQYTGRTQLIENAPATAPQIVKEVKTGVNLENSSFEISWGKSEDIKNLAQAVNHAQWQIDTFNPISIKE